MWPYRFISNYLYKLDTNYNFCGIFVRSYKKRNDRLAADLCAEKGTVPLLLVPADLFAEIGTRMQTQGVFTLSKPTSSMMLSQALRWMAAARERLRRTEKKTATIEEKMEEIRLVNRAKWLLIEQLKMTESDAHRYIEKQAMDRCVSRREIAQNIIRIYA